MSLWIPFTLMAALMQAIRTACQKTLAERSSATAATLARSLFALPLCWLYVATLWSSETANIELTTDLMFYAYSSFAAVAQIIATILMVRLFSQRNYAIGICYAKTEALLVALLGVLIFSEQLSTLGWLSVLFGALGILLLSPKPSADASFIYYFASPTAALGLSSGLAFALTSLAVRQAGLGLGEHLILNAAITLAVVISLQSILLGGYMLVMQRQRLIGLFSHWQLASWVGLTSVLGSIGWFTAMTLENPALVKTLGQIEFFFALILSARLFNEKHNLREYVGMVMILLSVIAILSL